MGQDFKILEELGFGKTMQGIVKAFIPFGSPHFSAGEQRAIGQGKRVKILAHLYYKKKEHSLAVRSYDVVDLTIRCPQHRRMAVQNLDQEMQLIDWNNPAWGLERIISVGRPKELSAKVNDVEEKLLNMQCFDVEGAFEAERLRLKYMYDSLYGFTAHLDSLNGDKYSEHYNMISVVRKPSLIPVKDAIDLLMNKGINNYNPDAVSAALIRKQLQIEQKRRPPTSRAGWTPDTQLKPTR